MLDFLPQTASVIRNDQIVEVDTQIIPVGEIVLIRSGARIPVNGRVLSGYSFVEQAAITGEPMPSEKLPGSDVHTGTINQAGTLQVRAERLGKETTFGKIIEAVENAERSRAPIQRTADRLAGYRVYFALGALPRARRSPRDAMEPGHKRVHSWHARQLCQPKKATRRNLSEGRRCWCQ
jgi:P-type E1-E2 ATPase